MEGSQQQEVRSNFGFLASRWPGIFGEARNAERHAARDPRSSLLYARRTLEQIVDWLYTADPSLSVPLKDELNNRLTDHRFKALVPARVLDKMHAVRKLGNQAVHGNHPVSTQVSLHVLAEAFHIAYWLGASYAASAAERPAPGTRFDPQLLAPGPGPGVVQLTRAEAEKLAERLDAKDAELKRAAEAAAGYEARIAELQEQVEAAKAANEAIPDEHDYTEAGTRVYIDAYLAEAGWDVDAPRVREFPVTGMPAADGSRTGAGRVDYVLWGANGKPLAVLEAKRTSRDAHAGKQQAKLYADALESAYGQRPVIYYSNGYRHWLWEDTGYPEREVLGFHTRDELQLMVDRRTQRRPLSGAVIPEGIADRPYQHRAIRAVAEAFDADRRRALLVMATGTGKTRTVVALTQLLSENRWAKRVLFLADRNALVTQAARAFKTLIPGSSPARLGTDDAAGSRIHLATYPTIMNIIAGSSEGRLTGPERRGIGYYDLVIVDEAHRSVYQKYRHVFAYFDALVIGLTATPLDEVDRNTYALFGIQDNNPTSAYELGEAIADGFLVPPRVIDVPVGFVREGVRYEDLSPEEQAEWDEKEWDEDGLVPEEVAAPELNRWLFNADTVDHVLRVLMERGRRVAGGDRLGKTIVFARNQDHAEFIRERFDANYPAGAGHVARVITHSVNYAQDLIDDFSDPAKAPDIAISVDMLDTGIDVPDVVNLVFFKPVRSKAKFWQMVGRGTRLRPELYGPGEDKDGFLVFDVCGNAEYFNAGLDAPDTVLTPSLAARTFATRVRLLLAATQREYDAGFRADLVGTLGAVVRSLPRNNFLVRPRLAEVERFAEDLAWEDLSEASAAQAEQVLAELAGVAVVGSADTDEDAKRFDLLALRTELAALTGDAAALAVLGTRLVRIAEALREKANIPHVAAQLAVIEAVAEMAVTDPEWAGVDPQWLETVRRRLRGLVRHLDKRRRKPVYADFEDTVGELTEVELEGVRHSAFDISFYRERVEVYVREHLDHMAVQRLRRGLPLTEMDLRALEEMLAEGGVGSAEDLERAAAGDVAGFIRSLVGLDQQAVQDAFADFIAETTLNSRQLELLNMVIKQLTRGGPMDAGALYEPPYTDIAAGGPEALFPEEDVDRIVSIINRLGGPGLPEGEWLVQGGAS
ncbi:DEAD/DEAH box helicase family protein [Zafaria sp. J156]|uniref:DEAD/DEAH box helicase family protein n=1 Tax=Zafaria sp. J156 TaxID=3116490 RepID=UPI002E781054|nr:DEAD/DEAH box helicase family protein [Zafaria sp. J156]MEE1621638.1 DEAD/DEAH box helicase family protein [Zafaria sp. J156]